MAVPFETEHIFMPRAFFRIQENVALASIPLPAHPSAQSGITSVQSYPGFQLGSRRPGRKGLHIAGMVSALEINQEIN